MAIALRPEKLAALCLLLSLAACSTYSPPGQETAPVVTTPEPTVVTRPEPPSQPREPEVKAHQQLIARADAASTRGDYESALALLERAQRIDPDNGEIYLELAKTYSARGDVDQARSTAERGMLYCNGKNQCEALRAYTR